MKKTNPQPLIVPNSSGTFQIEQIKEIEKYLGKIKSHDEIKIVYFGTPEFSAYILEKLIEFCQDSNVHPGGAYSKLIQNRVRSVPKVFTLQAVVTQSDQPVGRRQTITPSHVSLVAKKHGIPTLKPAKLDSEFLTSHLPLLTSDLFIVASYGKIIPQSLLDIPRLGSLNIHGSILPKYRGASPIQTAILNGDKKTGITIMLMNEQMDHGPILSTREISISDKDTYQSLSNKMAQIAEPLLIETMVKFVEGKIKPRGQNHAYATFCPLIKKEDGYFDIENPPSAEKLDRMIRAYYPWPGVWTKWRGKIVKFLPSVIPAEAGIHKNDTFLIQMEGKKVLSTQDFLNGYPDFPLRNL